MSSMSHYYDNWVSELKLWSMKYKKVLSVARATVLRVSQVKLWSMKNKSVASKCCLWHELQCCECHTGGIVSCAPSHSPHCHGQAFCPRTRLQCPVIQQPTRSQFIPEREMPLPETSPETRITGLALLGEPSKFFFGQTWDFVPTGLTPPPPRTLGQKK